MNHRYFLFPAIVIALGISSCDDSFTPVHSTYEWTFDSAHASVTQFVDPMIGTAGHGHTFPGATAPFGMVQLSPDTRIDGSWDGCSGYHYDDSIIYGFSHTHLSGTGCSDYGDIMLMPGIGNKSYSSGADTGSNATGYRQSFSHQNETAEAGYYSVKLDNGIFCEMTASPRVGVHRYNFSDYDEPWIILDMSHRDEVLECELEIVDDHTIRGKRFSKAWATNQQLYFYAEFSEPFGCSFWSNGKTFDAKSSDAKDLKAVFSFGSKSVEVKVALSPVSCENAKLNLDVETGGMNFDAVKEKVQRNWDSELSRIEIETDSLRKKTIFYTALYHCFIAPNVYCDVNGDYQGMDHKVYRDTVHQRYTVFSLWDTYRALHPLFTIIQQKRTNDFINTFLEIYKESGRLPVWELSSNETDCMIGYHSVSVITDAWMKGIVGYDTALAYEAMKASAMENRGGLEAYRKYGFIPAEGESESVSKTLEYSYDDWCISQCAKRMNDTVGEKYFERRGNNWKNMFNPETGFMQARLNNSFVEPFDPFEVNFHYTEANAWQYSMAVQQSPFHLAYEMGFKNFDQHLDSLFHVSSQTAGRDQADISGLIGQYAQGNEPSHHMAYLYTVIHEDEKTQKLVYDICTTLYSDKPDGLCGNEDCGQMSAWYVLSSCGFYQITPGKPVYDYGSTQFRNISFHLENGNTFRISARNADKNYPYERVVNGQNREAIGHTFLEHKEIMEGIQIEIEKDSIPTFLPPYYPNVVNDGEVVVPYITGANSRTFVDHLSFGMKTLFPDNQIFYSLNGGAFRKYTSAISINENTEVKMYGVGNIYDVPKITDYFDLLSNVTLNREVIRQIYSDTVIAHFFKAPAWKSIAIRNAYAPQYSAGGDRALIDGLTGTTNFRTGLWQGYEGTDMEVTIDLGKEMNVDSVYLGFLDDENAWIFAPSQVRVDVSNDTSRRLDNNIRPDYVAPGGKPAGANVVRVGTSGGVGRYVQVLVQAQKECPKGHPGEGKPAWLFCDEITIKTK